MLLIYKYQEINMKTYLDAFFTYTSKKNGSDAGTVKLVKKSLKHDRLKNQRAESLN